MTVLFLYTNLAAPAVSKLVNVTNIACSISDGVKTWTITAGGNTYTYTSEQGQLSVIWD